MRKSIAICSSVVLLLGLSTSVSYGQLDGLYVFDGGGDGTSWNDATNWEQVLDPDGNPISGDPATPPDPTTSANIPLTGVVIDNTMPGQTALDARIGTVDGAGSLNMSGGDLTIRDLFVGRDDTNGVNAGTFDMSGGMLVAGDDISVGAGSVGTMTMSDGAASTGDDFFINANSSMSMTGGVINVGDRLVLEDNGSLNVDGGQILAADDFFFFGDSQVTVDSGFIETVDKLRFDDDAARNGRVTVNGGIVRSQEFGFVDDAGDYILRGVMEINGDGIYQVEAPGPDSPVSQLSVEEAKLLIAQGVHFVTSELAPRRLNAFSVIVPEFAGRQDVLFTQINVVPEPTSLLLCGLGVLGFALRRRRA